MRKTTNIELGRRGEGLAAASLIKNGYRILERNYRAPLGEIDLIAKDGDTICFIEVKARTSYQFGSPFEAVDRRKQKKLAQLALCYLKYKRLMNAKARFDIVAVVSEPQREPTVEILKNAFDLPGHLAI